MSLKSQKFSARHLQPFGNDTRKTWGEGASEAPPPAKNSVNAKSSSRPHCVWMSDSDGGVPDGQQQHLALSPLFYGIKYPRRQSPKRPPPSLPTCGSFPPSQHAVVLCRFSADVLGCNTLSVTATSGVYRREAWCGRPCLAAMCPGKQSSVGRWSVCWGRGERSLRTPRGQRPGPGVPVSETQWGWGGGESQMKFEVKGAVL